MQKPGGRRGKLGNRGSRTPEREVGTSTDAPVALSGVLRGWADCEQGPALGGRSRTGGTPPKPPFGSFRAVPKGTRPSGRNLVVAKSALLRFRPKTAKTALRFLARPLPASPQAPYPSLPPLAKAHPFRCGSFPHKSTTFVGAPAIRFAGLRRGPHFFAVLPCNLLRRLRAPAFGVQTWGSAPLTARRTKVPCHSRRVAWAAGTQA